MEFGINGTVAQGSDRRNAKQFHASNLKLLAAGTCKKLKPASSGFNPNSIRSTGKEGLMQQRINYLTLAPGAYKAMLGLEEYLRQSGLEESLLHLIKLRTSQINGCAYCIDMHWKDLRSVGENEQRLYGLDAWRESPYYTERERAALAWTEAVTNIRDGHASDEDYEAVRRHFSEKELADLTLAVATINAWNRLAIAARSIPGTYQSAKTQATKKSA
jgi:AhpD family alkylhydroperoxidase